MVVSNTSLSQWMLHSQDSLHSGPASPVSIASEDITALLPCGEEDFALGRVPASRAALQDTLPAVDDPTLVRDPKRSLFASLIQVHHFWGIVGRRAVNYARSSRPWDPNTEFCQMRTKLREWENTLPQNHSWSLEALTAHKAKGQDLVCGSCTIQKTLIIECTTQAAANVNRPILA